MIKKIVAGLLLLVLPSGCGAIVSDMQRKGSTSFHGPISASDLSSIAKDNHEKRLAYGLFVRSKKYPLHEFIGTNPVSLPVGVVNLFIPLPSVRMAEFIAVHLRGLTDEDVEKVESALKKHSGMKWDNQQVVDGEIYFGSKKEHISFSITKSPYYGEKEYYMVIEGLRGREILDLVVKEIKISFSADYRKTYKSALSGIVPDTNDTYGYKDLFGSW